MIIYSYILVFYDHIFVHIGITWSYIHTICLTWWQHLEDSKRPLLEQQEKHRAAMAKKESCLKDASNDLEQSRAEIQKLKEDKTQTEKVQ